MTSKKLANIYEYFTREVHNTSVRPLVFCTKFTQKAVKTCVFKASKHKTPCKIQYLCARTHFASAPMSACLVLGACVLFRYSVQDENSGGRLHQRGKQIPSAW